MTKLQHWVKYLIKHLSLFYNFSASQLQFQLSSDVLSHIKNKISPFQINKKNSCYVLIFSAAPTYPRSCIFIVNHRSDKSIINHSIAPSGTSAAFFDPNPLAVLLKSFRSSSCDLRLISPISNAAAIFVSGFSAASFSFLASNRGL